MYKIRFVLFLVLVVGLIGCRKVPSPTAVLLIETKIPTIQPMVTSSQVPTATQTLVTPTLTPEPGLRTDGPYFAYFRQVNEIYHFVMMDADGGGRKAINLPQEIKDLDAKLVSPDGHWLVFYTGSAGDFMQMPAQGTADLALNLMDLKTGETQTVTSLLSGNYPNNFIEAAEKINNQNITAGSLYTAFISGITRAIAWSPDGHCLAFAGQMDGLSSDLYLYDLATKTLKRLSSGDEEMQWIEWSPDGKWILHGSTFESGMGVVDDIYAAALDGGPVKYLVKASAVGGWLEFDKFLVYDNQNVFGDFEFRLIDIKTGAIRKIWDGPVLSYAINSSEKKVAIFAHMFEQSPYLVINPDPNFVPGLYLIDLETFKVTYVETPNDMYRVDSFTTGNNIFAFTALGLDQTSFLLSETEELSSLDKKEVQMIKSSPDGTYWIVVTDNAIELYSSIGVLINSFSLPLKNILDIQEAIFLWQPDSSGLILISEANIYFVNFVTGVTKLVERNYLNYFLTPNYLWINSQ